VASQGQPARPGASCRQRCRSGDEGSRVCSRCSDLEQQLQALRGKLRDELSRHERDISVLKAEHEREARELTGQLEEYLAVIEH